MFIIVFKIRWLSFNTVFSSQMKIVNCPLAVSVHVSIHAVSRSGVVFTDTDSWPMIILMEHIHLSILATIADISGLVTGLPIGMLDDISLIWVLIFRSTG